MSAVLTFTLFFAKTKVRNFRIKAEIFYLGFLGREGLFVLVFFLWSCQTGLGKSCKAQVNSHISKLYCSGVT